MRTLLLLIGLVGPAQADIFFHAPRGSNNKLHEVSNQVENQARLFDSKNNSARPSVWPASSAPLALNQPVKLCLAAPG